MAMYRNHKFEDVCRQGYADHIHAMTVEELYSKADIAEELTVRDSTIESLRQQLAEAQRDAERMREALEQVLLSRNIVTCGINQGKYGEMK